RGVGPEVRPVLLKRFDKSGNGDRGVTGELPECVGSAAAECLILLTVYEGLDEHRDGGGRRRADLPEGKGSGTADRQIAVLLESLDEPGDGGLRRRADLPEGARGLFAALIIVVLEGVDEDRNGDPGFPGDLPEGEGGRDPDFRIAVLEGPGKRGGGVLRIRADL